ncbi:hypothetical protein AV530_015671 [Patagioenas fasciata monilis]|uniref:Uncharacterized protein n=1 Tax=Patagioenas fasciata monilis TaxID=372326 RepID=A0A1V4KIB0_PATFA|nr:hypothetical protein AV530_015671 [Patagioenas fasciata monilis]
MEDEKSSKAIRDPWFIPMVHIAPFTKGFSSTIKALSLAGVLTNKRSEEEILEGHFTEPSRQSHVSSGDIKFNKEGPTHHTGFWYLKSLSSWPLMQG